MEDEFALTQVSPLSARRCYFAALLARDYDINTAADIAKISKGQAYTWAKTESLQQLIASYKEKPALITIDLLSEGLVRALATMGEFLASDDAKQRFGAAKMFIEAGLAFQLKMADVLRRRGEGEADGKEEKAGQLNELLPKLDRFLQRLGRGTET